MYSLLSVTMTGALAGSVLIEFVVRTSCFQPRAVPQDVFKTHRPHPSLLTALASWRRYRPKDFGGEITFSMM